MKKQDTGRAEGERRTCYRCKQPDGTGPRELRPYGPNGALVCAECALGSAEGRREAEKQFAARLNAIDGPAVLACALLTSLTFRDPQCIDHFPLGGGLWDCSVQWTDYVTLIVDPQSLCVVVSKKGRLSRAPDLAAKCFSLEP